LLARKSYIIFRRGWLLTKLQSSPASVTPYARMNIFVLSSI
jgi:hypothetical protein